MFLIALQSGLEVANSFSQAFGQIRDLLAAEQQHGDAKYDERLLPGKAENSSALKALRKHYGHLSIPILQ